MLATRPARGARRGALPGGGGRRRRAPRADALGAGSPARAHPDRTGGAGGAAARLVPRRRSGASASDGTCSRRSIYVESAFEKCASDERRGRAGADAVHPGDLGGRTGSAATSTTRTTRSSRPRTTCRRAARRATTRGRSAATTPRWLYVDAVLRYACRIARDLRPRPLVDDSRQVFARTATGVRRITWDRAERVCVELPPMTEQRIRAAHRHPAAEFAERRARLLEHVRRTGSGYVLFGPTTSSTSRGSGSSRTSGRSST